MNSPLLEFAFVKSQVRNEISTPPGLLGLLLGTKVGHEVDGECVGADDTGEREMVGLPVGSVDKDGWDEGMDEGSDVEGCEEGPDEGATEGVADG
jgi:hypothetical protein